MLGTRRSHKNGLQSSCAQRLSAHFLKVMGGAESTKRTKAADKRSIGARQSPLKTVVHKSEDFAQVEVART